MLGESTPRAGVVLLPALEKDLESSDRTGMEVTLSEENWPFAVSLGPVSFLL